MQELTNKDGVLILEQISFNNLAERIVGKNNKSSGKVTLPKKWIGKKVYVIMDKDGKK